MTNLIDRMRIERKALELVNEVAQDVRYEPDDFEEERRDVFKALCRAIEQHEAFRQEVSDAAEFLYRFYGVPIVKETLDRFIVAKPDPLVDAWLDAFPGNHMDDAREECAKICAALAKRGLEIKEKSDG